MSSYEIIGLMSGTSLDGLDITYSTYTITENECDSFQLHAFDTVPFPEDIYRELDQSQQLNSTSLAILDKRIGRFYADSVNEFILKHQLKRHKIDAIACHGQTILHQPHNGFTLQIGCGDTLAFHTELKVINNFRNKDIVAGGQGAPLVPIGDFGLFRAYAEAFLNIGGFCNVSWKNPEGRIVAYDVCPGNLPLNKLAKAKGLAYDSDGKLAASGSINFFLLDLLNSLEYYAMQGPKSLGTEWLETTFYPLVKFDREIENNMCTLCEHIAFQIAMALNESGKKSVLLTGGGSKNTFLIKRIEHYYDGTVILPEVSIIDNKEALIFGYLGALYLAKKPNTIPSVTGASHATMGGVLHLP